jgi:excinuclease ABC subunit B
VSATPADYELTKCGGVVVEQIIRPTGLLDPEIEVRPSKNQIDDLLEEIAVRAEKDERTLVTTLTKRMAEELDVFLKKNGVRSTYIHSDVDTLERVQILEDLRKGLYDVLIGVNLLREGIDLPQVSLVAILDADKEGFLRSHRSLTQTAGRAARNLEGKVLMYADTITDSMRKTIDETNRRRSIQQAYNQEHGITPRALNKKSAHALSGYEATGEAGPFDKFRDRASAAEPLGKLGSEVGLKDHGVVAVDPVMEHMSKAQLEKAIATTKKRMLEASKNLDFLQAAQYRDEMLRLEDMLQHLK